MCCALGQTQGGGLAEGIHPCMKPSDMGQCLTCDYGNHSSIKMVVLRIKFGGCIGRELGSVDNIFSCCLMFMQ